MQSLKQLTKALRRQLIEKRRYVRQLDRVIACLDPQPQHWTKRPENRRKMLAVVHVMQKAKAA
jgi:hypothetical protein